MHQGEIHARIQAIRRQFVALRRELDELLEQLDEDDGGSAPPTRFRIIGGGLAALAALADWLRRRPAALIGATIAAGTAILVLVAPQGGTAPTQQLSLPPAGSFARSVATPPPTTPPTASTPAPTATPETSPPEWVYLSPPHSTPKPITSGTAPATPTTSPTPTAVLAPSSPAPTDSCVVEAAVPGVLHLCVA